MAVIKQLIDNDTGTQIYPITTTSAVLDNDSNTLLSLLDDKANADDMSIVENANTLTKSIQLKPNSSIELNECILLTFIYSLTDQKWIFKNINNNILTYTDVVKLFNNPHIFVILKYIDNHTDVFYFYRSNLPIQNVSLDPIDTTYEFYCVCPEHQIYFLYIYGDDNCEVISVNIPLEGDNLSLILMDSVASVGSNNKYARIDHRHPSDTSRVPTSRTINGKALSSDITLTASDVGAMSTSHPANVITSAKISQWDSKQSQHRELGEFIQTYLENLPTSSEDARALTQEELAGLATISTSDIWTLLNYPCGFDWDLLQNWGEYSWSANIGSIIWEYRITNNSGLYWVQSSTETLQHELVSGTNIKTINNQSLLGSGNLTANDIGAATVSDVNTAISNLVDSAPTTLNTLNELATALGNDPNFATTITNKIAALLVHVGSVAGKLYRNNVAGSGNFTVTGNSGCIPNLTAGTFLVSIYAKSATQSYTFRFNFGSSVTYDLSTTNGEISDVRQITIPSNGTFSGLVLNGSVASGTILYVVLYNYLTPISTVGPAAVTNRHSDLDGIPNGTLTIKQNGTTVGTFTANQSSNTTANITVPTVDSSLTGSSQTNPVEGGAIYNALLNKQNKSIEMFVAYETLLSTLTGTSYENPVTLTGTALEQYNDLVNKYTDGSYSFLFLGTPLVTDSETWENIGAMTFNILYGGNSLTDSISSFTINKQGDNYWVENTSRSIQAQLVSGTNIKTVNNQSLLGSGNLTPSLLGVPNIANNLTTTTTGSTLDATQGKALKDLIDGITVPSASTTTPVMDGTAAIGSSSEYAKADHIHPSDTSKANVITKTTVSTSGAVSLAMTSGVFYSFTGTPTSLTLTLTAPSTGLGIYAGKFTASSTGCTLSVPASVTESIDNPNIVANGTYEFNIMDNVLLMVQI